MIDDAYQGLYDIAVLVTGDSDLVPAVELVKTRFPAKKVWVYVPIDEDDSKQAKKTRKNKFHNLQKVADGAKPLPPEIIRGAQFSNPVIKGQRSVVRPAGW